MNGRNTVEQRRFVGMGRVSSPALLMIFIWFLILCAAPASGLRGDEVAEGIRREINQIEERLEELARQRETLLGQLERLDLEDQRESRLIEQLSRKIALNDELRRKSGAAVERLAERSRSLQSQLADRLGTLYRLGRMHYLRMLLSAVSAEGARDRVRYMSYLAGRDARLIAAYRENIIQLRLEQENLDSAAKSLVLLNESHEERRRNLSGLRDEKRQLIDGLSGRIADRQQIIAELEEAATSLESLMHSFSSDGSPTAKERAALLPSILKYRGMLPWPAQGKVTQSFGRKKHPRFGTVTISNGIEIGVPRGNEILAVYFGAVVYSEWFHGYGNLVILDHGGEAYSLYGHLDRSDVQIGDWINKGDTLGLSGSTGSLSGPVLYFEIRVGGEPADPRLWLVEHRNG